MSKTLSPEARARIIAVQKARRAKAREKKTPAAPRAGVKASAGSRSPRNGAHINGNGKNGNSGPGRSEPDWRKGGLPGAVLAKAAREPAGRLKAAMAVSAGTLMQLDPKTCRRSPWNREEFDDPEMAKLVADVKENGVNQNGIVRKNPGVEIEEKEGKFLVKSRGGGMLIESFNNKRAALQLESKLDKAEWEIIAGERRWTAAMKAGRPFPAVERQATDTQALELQASENMLREDLNPMDEAIKFEQLRAAYVAEGMTRMEALERIEQNTGKAESTILERLTLVSLPDAVQKLIRKGSLHASHAGLLTKLNDPANSTKLAVQMQKNGQGESMSFRDAKKLVDHNVQVEKNLAEWQRQKAEFEKKNFAVLSLEKCAQIIDSNGPGHFWVNDTRDYVAGNTTCQLAGSNWRNYDKLWRKAPEPILARTPDGQPVIIYLRVAADEAAKAGGKLTARSGKSSRPESEVKMEREKKEHRAEFLGVVPGIVEFAGKSSDSTEFWKIFARALVRRAGSDPVKLVSKRRWKTKGAEAHGEIENRLKEMSASELRGLCTEILLYCEWPHSYSRSWGEMIDQAAYLSGQQLSKWGKSQTSGKEREEEPE